MLGSGVREERERAEGMACLAAETGSARGSEGWPNNLAWNNWQKCCFPKRSEEEDGVTEVRLCFQFGHRKLEYPLDTHTEESASS